MTVNKKTISIKFLTWCFG